MRSYAHTRLAVLVASAAVVSCVPLVDGAYIGEPLFEIQGSIYLDSDPMIGQMASLEIGVLWLGDLEWRAPERHVLSRGSFPARYTLEFFVPPPARTLRRDAGGLDQLAIGRIILFADYSGNKVFDVDEDLVVGGVEDVVIVYASAATGLGVMGLEERPGFHIARWESCERIEQLATDHRIARRPGAADVDLRLLPAARVLDSDLYCTSRSADPCATLLAIGQTRASDPPTQTLVALARQIYGHHCPLPEEPTAEQGLRVCLEWLDVVASSEEGFSRSDPKVSPELYQWCTGQPLLASPQPPASSTCEDEQGCEEQTDPPPLDRCQADPPPPQCFEESKPTQECVDVPLRCQRVDEEAILGTSTEDGCWPKELVLERCALFYRNAEGSSTRLSTEERACFNELCSF
jgi:hypothetical protein